MVISIGGLVISYFTYKKATDINKQITDLKKETFNKTQFLRIKEDLIKRLNNHIKSLKNDDEICFEKLCNIRTTVATACAYKEFFSKENNILYAGSFNSSDDFIMFSI